LKVCRICKKEKALSEYYKAFSNKDKHCNTCKKCKTKLDGEYRKRSKTPEKKAYERAMHIRRKFGISVEEYQKLEKTQDTCAICSNLFIDTFDKQLDHCHSTGKIRKFLCQKCNKALGLFNDDTKILTSALNYLKENI